MCIFMEIIWRYNLAYLKVIGTIKPAHGQNISRYNIMMQSTNTDHITTCTSYNDSMINACNCLFADHVHVYTFDMQVHMSTSVVNGTEAIELELLWIPIADNNTVTLHSVRGEPCLRF